MRKSKKIVISLFLAAALVGSTVSHAATLSKGMKGSGGQILSKVTTYAGSGEFGNANGEVSEASFRTPHRLVILADGSVLVSDSRNHLIRRISDKDVATFAGITLDLDQRGFPEGGWSDGHSDIAVFNEPAGMSVDGEGNVYVADAANNVIRKITGDGNVSTIAGQIILGNEDGIGDKASFNHPMDVVVADDGTLYVADTLNHLIRSIAVDGTVMTLNAASDRIVEVIDGLVEPAGDYVDGALSEAKFNEPTSLALDSLGNLYVSDTGNQLIRYIDLAHGIVSTVAGSKLVGDVIYEENELYAVGGYSDGPATEASFNAPRGIAVTAEDGLIIADSLNHVIRYLKNDIVITVAGNPEGIHGNVNGINGHNALYEPTDIAILSDGSFVIADSYNELIRQYSLYRLPSQLPQNDEVKVVLDDEIIVFDAKPELVNGRVMVPVRALAEAMDYVVGYDDESVQTITLTKDNIRLELIIGNNMMTSEHDGQEKETMKMDIAPFIKESRTYVPVRFFSEAFGLDVQWSQNNTTVIVREVIE